MIIFIHNQGHIKIIIINEPQYDLPWSMLYQYFCSFNYNFYIFHIPERLSLRDCLYDTVHFHVTGVASRPMGRHENILDISRSRSYQIKLHHKYIEIHHQLFLGIFTILFFDPNAPHTTRFVSIYMSLSITTYHWFITHINTKHIVSQNIRLTKTYKHQTSCQSEHHIYQNI